MRRADLLVGVGLLVVAILYYQQTFAITVGFASDRLGPAFFPRLLALALGSCAVALSWRSIRGRSDPGPLPPVQARLFLATLGLTVAYALLLPSLGYLLATPLYVVAVVGVLGYRHPGGLAAAAVGITGVLYLVFVRALKVLVPMGPLGR
ncbi:MAG: tripartite tricarboxylate transporter TctB family protein [Armatimonadota bacterium]|nr:tripartite tricarboxylate transporter TctB family protein [Armatimonadota bacterium]